MGDAAKRARFEWLRECEEAGMLTDTEQVELAEMIEEIERTEQAYLRPATERARAQRAELSAQNDALQHLLQRRRALARRLQKTVTAARAEQAAIEKELSRILAGAAD